MSVLQRRPDGGDGGAEMPSMGRRQKVAMAISAPVLPPEMATSASPSLTDWSAVPHRGIAAALAQGLAGLFVHRDDVVGMDDARDLLEIGVLRRAAA